MCCICINAQQRSENEAIKIAKSFWGQQGKMTSLSVVSPQKINVQVRKKITRSQKALPQNNSCYVVNDDANGRFVIVSADERLNTILGYSENGNFEASSMPDALIGIIDGYNRQYDYLLANESNIPQRTPAKTTSKVIEPLIKSQWGQSAPYNDQCPENLGRNDGSKCATGCVATAMAQIMNYFQYPSMGKGYYSYYTASQHIFQSQDFNQLNFNWNNILNVYDDNSTDEQKYEVAKLMHACGVSVSMDYGTEDSEGNATDESGAYSQNIPYALINYFQYNSNTLFRDRNYYTESEWDAYIMQELEAGHPILYSGQGSGGHQFILDGSDADGKYHLNFGWNGLADGYFELDAITPFWGLLGNYSYYQTMICQISPQSFGKHEDIFYSDVFTINSSSISVGSSTYFSLKPICYSSNSTYQEKKIGTFNGEIGVGVFDSNYNFIQSLYKMNVTSVGIGEVKNLSYKSITFDASLFKANTKYAIIPYAKDNSSTIPTIIRTPYGKVAYYEAVTNGNKVELTPKYEFETENGGEIVPNPIVVGNFKATAYNAFNSQEEWTVTVWQDQEDNKKYWISNFDPTVKKKGFTSENGWNKVYGYANIAGTEIEIPTDQYLGKNIRLNNFSDNSDITLSLSYQNKTMSISDVWGTLETKSVSDGNTTSEEVSRYTNSRFVFTTESEQEETVTAPIINVSNNGVLTIICNTVDAQIYYTTDGTAPTASSTLYNKAVSLTGNGIVKAIAVKNGKLSDVTQYTVDVFVVKKPVINAHGNIISISCATTDADIYYTLDGSTPNINNTKYTGPFECSQSAVIKVIAIKSKYNDSEVVTYIHQADNPDSSTHQSVTITDLVAGQLPNMIPFDKKLQIANLTISGKLNGTDIKFIREMIIDGKLTDLNIQKASIVSGGDVYYSSYTKDYTTENNIIGNYMFYNCKGLISLLLPSDATRINGNSIENCDNLKTLKLPLACTVVEMFGIYRCENLESVTLAPSTNDIHWGNMNFCPNLTRIEVENGNETYVSEDGILFSKDKTVLVKYPVGKPDKIYSIPSCVKTIAHGAFTHSRLEGISIPEGLTTIGTSAFEYNNSLTGIVIPNSVTSMEMMAFCNCANLSSITISDNLKEIEGLTFGYCVNLQSVNIPCSVEKINGTAFSGCTSLKVFTVSDGNIWFTANDGVIYTKNMKALIKCPIALYATAYQIPDDVEEIYDYAFNRCKNIERFYLPESVKSIGTSAFGECSMSSISLPQSISTIDMMAFEKCDNLESFIIPDNVEEIPMMLVAYSDKLSYLYIPANVKTVGGSAFSNCKSLAMINCNVVNIDLVDFKKSYDEIVETFKNIPDTCTWRIPTGCRDKYKAQSWWVPTWRIIEEAPNSIDDVSIDNNLLITCKEGQLTFVANKDGVVRIYTSNGINVRNQNVKAGETYQIGLNKEIYIVNNMKVLIQ